MKNSDERSVPPKVYALLIESQKNFFLSVQYAYSLEDAFYLARLEFAEQNPPTKNGMPNTLDGAKIGLFTIKTVSKLTDDIEKIPSAKGNSTYLIKDEGLEPATPEEIMDAVDKLFPIIPVTPALPKIPKVKEEVIPKLSTDPGVIKNNLMGEIISKGDIGLYNKNKHLFTTAERKYIKEHLK